MPKRETLMVTCIGCKHVNQIPVENLLDYSCITCGKSSLLIKETEQEALVNELDEASNEMDRVIGSVVNGRMDSEMASDWLEHESSQIVETLDKAREFLEESDEIDTRGV
ncbi:hypothetical protein AB4Z29_16350 [Paenibacillus sp. 2TAB23]|uniref:hypothetical protein n=1 Tax=Paenibacillus sp. 2TAB23 TaxID=3233004 RepID=UPI003F957F9F